MSTPARRPERPCAFDGCAEVIRARLGFCPTHFTTAYRCEFDEHCQNRCSARSATRLCHEHSWYAYKLRRARLLDWLEETES